jgi:hypothetical protein
LTTLLCHDDIQEDKGGEEEGDRRRRKKSTTTTIAKSTLFWDVGAQRSLPKSQ